MNLQAEDLYNFGPLHRWLENHRIRTICHDDNFLVPYSNGWKKRFLLIIQDIAIYLPKCENGEVEYKIKENQHN